MLIKTGGVAPEGSERYRKMKCDCVPDVVSDCPFEGQESIPIISSACPMEA